MSRLTHYSLATAGVFSAAVIADQLSVRSKRLDLDYSRFNTDTINAAVQNAKTHFAARDKKQNLTLTALEKHVLAFGNLDSKTHKVKFDAFTTAFALRNMGEPLWPVIGFFVALGSKLQAGKCPLGSAEFDIAKGEHLGTSRVWDQKGNFNEERWDAILAKINSQNGFITQSEWYKAVAELVQRDQPEEGTNRKPGTDFVHKTERQIETAKREAKEMFKLLGRKQGNDLVMPAWLIKLYFEDTRAALMAVSTLKNQFVYDGSVWNSRAMGLSTLLRR